MSSPKADTEGFELLTSSEQEQQEEQEVQEVQEQEDLDAQFQTTQTIQADRNDTNDFDSDTHANNLVPALAIGVVAAGCFLIYNIWTQQQQQHNRNSGNKHDKTSNRNHNTNKMGCFQSKIADDPPVKAPNAASNKAAAAAAPVPQEAKKEPAGLEASAQTVPTRPKVKITERDQAMLDLKNNRDKLEQYKKRTRVQMEKQEEVAKQLLVEGKRDRARLALQMKKSLQMRVQDTEGQLANVEKLLNAMEMANLTKDVMESIEQGNHALKELNAELDLEKIDLLLQDTEEQIQYAHEVAARLAGNPLPADQQEQIDEELEALIAAEEKSKADAAKVPATSVPVGKPEAEAEPEPEPEAAEAEAQAQAQVEAEAEDEEPAEEEEPAKKTKAKQKQAAAVAA